MLDFIALAVTHSLLLVAVWRLLSTPDLDREDPPEAQTIADADAQTAARPRRARRRDRRDA